MAMMMPLKICEMHPRFFGSWLPAAGLAADEVVSLRFFFSGFS